MITDMRIMDVENTEEGPSKTGTANDSFTDPKIAQEPPTATAAAAAPATATAIDEDGHSTRLEFSKPEPQQIRQHPSATPVWFGTTDQPLRGWLHRPVGDSRNSRRVVIVPGFGYEELTSGWGLRMLAEELAAAGHTVLRYDHPGTGDSSGNVPSLSAWFTGVHEAVSALGVPDVTLIGVRLGATLALSAAGLGSEAITQIIAVSPVVSGRRMIRELTMLAASKKAVSPLPVGDVATLPLEASWATPITKGASPTSATETGALVVGGFAYPPDLQTGLRSLDLLSLSVSPAPRVEIIHAAERSTDVNLATHLRSLGTAVYESRVEGIGSWLDTSSELAAAPRAFIDLANSQLHGESMVDADEFDQNADRAFGDRAVIHEGSAELTERVFQVGEPQLSVVLTEPVSQEANGARTAKVAVLLLNSGVERNIGPGRAWVDWSRSLATSGHTVLRLDLSGVGNSGTWPGKPAFHSYGEETFDDVALGIAELRALGHQRIVVAGLCASAFSALGMPPHPSVVGIVSLSPQLYRCGTPGSMAEAEDTNFNRHRISQLDQKLNLRRKAAAVEELVGKRHLSTSWIDAWIAQGTHVRLVFGPEDRGLRFLQWRTPRSLKRLAKHEKFSLQVHPALDHALHEAPARDELFNDFCKLLESLSS
jgi:pimeloyl-ACP methyl ester carboxylesterase